jgi:hypothetical protein
MKPAEYSNLDMLMTCRTIAENFSLHIVDLQQVKKEWNEDFANSLIYEIETAFHYYIGVEANNKIAQVKSRFNHIQAQAIRAIAFLKTRIDIAFALNEDRKKEILNALGFDLYAKALHEKNSEALLDLLSNIEKNLTPTIKNELVKNSADQAFLDRISGYAEKIKKVNQSQNSLLATKKAIAEDALLFFNELLLKILDISQTIASYYKDNPEKAKMFDYTSVMSHHFPDSVQSN